MKISTKIIMWAAVYSSVDSKYKLKNSHTKLRSYLFLKSHIQEERYFKVNDKKNTLRLGEC